MTGISLSHNFLLPFPATPFQGFYFQFCDVAKFGYRSESKVKKFKNPALFWRPSGPTA
jgi:hypothetical protein